MEVSEITVLRVAHWRKRKIFVFFALKKIGEGSPKLRTCLISVSYTHLTLPTIYSV